MSSKLRVIFGGGPAVTLLPGAVVVALVVSAGGIAAAGPSPPDEDVAPLLAKVGQYVQRYFSRAQMLLSHERVRIQPLGRDLIPNGRARRLEYELRVEWAAEQPGEATVVRTALAVDGRAPDADSEPGCMDPHAVSPEPLAQFLPERQGDYTFRWIDEEREDGRRAVVLEYRATVQGPPDVTWSGECVSVELPGRSVGRVWVEPESGEVLRIDEHLGGVFEIPIPPDLQRRGAPRMVIERVDSSIRYREVTLQEPDATLRMPARIETVTIVRDAGVPRTRTTHTFSNYRRFVTDARIVVE